MVEIKVDDKIYEVYARDEHSLKKEPHIRDKATGEVVQNQKLILCNYLINIGIIKEKVNKTTHWYVYQVLKFSKKKSNTDKNKIGYISPIKANVKNNNCDSKIERIDNKIHRELKKADDYLLKKIKDTNLVELTLENVAKVEAMIQTDSAYRKSSDKYAKPIENKNKEKNGPYKYNGSTAFWMTQLRNMIIEHLPVSYSYEQIIEGAIKAVDRENSTHLNADLSGIKEITQRLTNIDGQELIKKLKKSPKKDKFGLIKTISAPTNPQSKPSRTNVSFASKFCHYASFYLFDGKPEQDNYSIYDNVLRKAIPLYLEYYKIKDINYDYLDLYEVYYDAIGKIIEKSGSGISRNGFDHLLWYYFKGR